jgi:predicted  nucleic acid-binding Zn-ribbon protein
MASAELQRLWKLARIDTGLVEVRKRAAALDVGQSIAAEIKRLEAEDADVGAKARALHAEQLDLELRQKTIEDKLTRIGKEMYGGTVTSPREVENLEKEIAALRRQRDKDDERLLELFEEVPPAQAAAKKIEDQINDAKARLAARKQKALQEKTALEQEFARLNAARPEAAKGISPSLLARYDAIRQKTDGVGMVELRGNSCGGCGTLLPERTLQALREDKLATCESCHRILYYSEGVV